MNKLILGLMSGTSADGLTISAITVRPFKIVHFKNYSYPASLQQKLLKAVNCTVPQLSALHYKIGALYAELIHQFLKDFHLTANQIAAVGMHGQTIYHGPHDPTPNTFQIAEPSFIASNLHVPVVSDFRAMDIALGGEGAPLMPFFDQYIWGKKTNPKILLNIGGISNISVVGKNIKTFGFDCGPGNTLIDLACQQDFKKPFDRNGAKAAQGTPNTQLVSTLLKQAYFSQKPPKSLDKNTFGQTYLKRHFSHLEKHDRLATLTYFTAAAIAYNITHFVPKQAQKEIVLSGGGCYNKTLVQFLQKLLPHIAITTSLAYGIDPQAKESAAFALFAYLALKHRSNHCAYATGACKNAMLGKVTLWI